MEDTLRYFFSSIFQGIAAILTLGAMFYMNYLEKVKSRIEELINKTKTMISITTVPESIIELEQNMLEVMRHKIEIKKGDENYNRHFKILDEYDLLNHKVILVKEIIKPIIFQGIVLLVISGISLFGVGYSNIGNNIAFCFGILILFIMSAFLKNLVAILRITTDIGALRIKDLFYVYKSKKKDY